MAHEKKGGPAVGRVVFFWRAKPLLLSFFPFPHLSQKVTPPLLSSPSPAASRRRPARPSPLHAPPTAETRDPRSQSVLFHNNKRGLLRRKFFSSLLFHPDGLLLSTLFLLIIHEASQRRPRSRGPSGDGQAGEITAPKAVKAWRPKRPLFGVQKREREHCFTCSPKNQANCVRAPPSSRCAAPLPPCSACTAAGMPRCMSAIPCLQGTRQCAHCWRRSGCPEPLASASGSQPALLDQSTAPCCGCRAVRPAIGPAP